VPIWTDQRASSTCCHSIDRRWWTCFHQLIIAFFLSCDHAQIGLGPFRLFMVALAGRAGDSSDVHSRKTDSPIHEI
jgi:hypothetical protein